MWFDQLSDKELLARTLEAEAGNQGFQGMLAVAAVIKNRAGSRENMRATILKPGQFSAWNSETGFANGAQGQNMKTIEPSDNAYAAAAMIDGVGFEDPTGGATHYYNPDLANPKWGSQGGGNWNKIGDHVFGVPEGEQDNSPIGKFNMVDQTFNNPNVNYPQKMIHSPMQAKPAAPAAPGAPQGMMGRGFMNTLADPRVRQMLGSMSRTQFGARIADQAKSEIGNNATAEYLEKQPGGKPFADMIRSGALSAEQAYTQWNAQANKKRNVKEVNGNLIDVDTGEIIYGDDVKGKLSEQQFTTLKSINSDLVKRTKEFGEIRDGFLRIKDLYDNPSGVNDYGLAVAFAKILDPGSVAREGEVRAVSKAGSPFYAFAAQAKNFFSGKGTLPAKVRNEIMNSANISYGRYKKIAQDAVADAERLANATGVPKEFLYKVPMPDVEMIIQSIPLDGDENDDTSDEPVILEDPADLPPMPLPLEKKFRQKKGLGEGDPLSEADQQELNQTWIRMWNGWPQDKKDTFLISPQPTN